jgi:hypothetical protein
MDILLDLAYIFPIQYMYAQNMYYVLGINYQHTSVGKFLGLECQTQGLGSYDLELNSHFFNGTGMRIRPWN